MKVGLHQGFVLSPLLFSVVSNEARSGMPAEFLYDLVFRAPTMEQPGRRVAEWRNNLLTEE